MSFQIQCPKHNPWKKTVDLDFSKIQNVFSVKGIFKKMNRWAEDLEKIFEKHVFAKGLVSWTHKELLNLNYRKPPN